MILKNKRIVIIGGTSGMGLSATKAFIKHGAEVVAVGLNDENLETAQKELASKALILPGDARHEGTAQKAIENCINS